MKIYRVAFFTETESSQGFEFFKNKVLAESRLAKFKKETKDDYDDGRSSVDCFDVELSANGILDILNQVASQPQNG